MIQDVVVRLVFLDRRPPYLGKNPDDGLYLAYCPLSGIFVSGSRCLPYLKKVLLLDIRELKTITLLGILTLEQHADEERKYAK